MKHYKFFLILILVLVITSFFLTVNQSEGACTCSVTGSGQYVVINPLANGIFKVEFTLISPYTFGSMTPPSGWTYTLSNGNRTATFLSSGPANDIKSQKCLTFTLNVSNYSGDPVLVMDTVAGYDRFGTKVDLSTNFAKLLVNIIAEPPSVATGGTITVNMTVQNNDGSITATITPSALTLNNPALATLASGPTPATLSLAPGASGVFTWTYTAAASGALTFSGSASDTSNCLYSQWTISNVITIGNFTASLTVTPDIVTTGNDVTVTMAVTNNSGAPLTNVTPSALTTGGTATIISSSGPTPATISSLASGSSGSFQWTYTISGSAGQTYWFQGNATAAGGYTTNTATSNTGQLSACSASAGSVVNNCGTYTATWTLCNNSGSPVNRIDFKIPWPWIISSVSTGLGTVATQLSPTATTNGSVVIDPASLATGNCGTVGITFSSIPDGGTYSFPVNMQGGGCTPINTVLPAPYGETTLLLSASPTSIPPDGTSTSTITARLCANSILSGSISFSTEAGTLSPSSQSVSTSACSPCTGCPACSTQSGTTAVTLTSSNGPSRNVTVTGQFLTSTGTTIVRFIKIRILNWREVH